MLRVDVTASHGKTYRGEFDTLKEANLWIADQKKKYGRGEGEGQYVITDITEEVNSRKLKEQKKKSDRIWLKDNAESILKSSDLDANIKEIIEKMLSIIL